MRVLLLAVGADSYALPLESVREVVPSPALTPLPHAPGHLLGLMNLRGSVIPVASAAALLGIAGDAATPGHVVVADVAGARLGLAVGAAPVAAELGESLGPAIDPRALGRYEAGDRVATLLDAHALAGA